MSSEFGSAFAASIYQEYRTMEGFPIHVIESWLVSKGWKYIGLYLIGPVY